MKNSLILRLMATAAMLVPVIAFPQEDHNAKDFAAYRLDEKITIDGILDESVWANQPTTGFIQVEPIEGALPTHATEVIVAYDDRAIYLAAKMYDSAPDSITARLGRRDDDVQSDFIAMALDPWLDHQSGFFFVVTAGGSIMDGTIFNDDSFDTAWDGIWDSAVQITSEGWTAEFRIPFSQLRFPDRPVHTWGINFRRIIERSNENLLYVLVPQNSSGFASRFAHLTDIRDISRPSKFEFLPYSSGKSALTHPDKANPFNDGSTLNGQMGLDLKVGLTSSLTLDATINPDFGQVEVDPAVVNLSDFETFFPEKRPFFIEGQDIFRFGRGGVNNSWSFNWGNPNHFYSRRIGRSPQGYTSRAYDYADIPGGTSILGAAKVTGKITETWSVGVASALTAREIGQFDSSGTLFEDDLEPRTIYNVIRAKREFAEGRHGLGILASMTSRNLETENLQSQLTSSSSDVGVDGWLTLDEERVYVINGWGATSRISGDQGVISTVQGGSPHYFNRPDVDYLGVDSSATDLAGFSGRLYLNKQKGNVVFNAALGTVSPGYEVNNLGFQSFTDRTNAHTALGYRTFDPGKYFRSTFFALATFRNRDYGGTTIGGGSFLFASGELLNYWNLNLNAGTQMEALSSNLTRGGVYATTPAGKFIFTSIRSDSRKDLSVGFNISYGAATRTFKSAGADINYRPNATVKLTLSPSYVQDITEATWVGLQEDASASATYGKRYLFAETVQTSFSLGTRLNWTFSPKLSLQLYAQPLVFAIDYFDYKELKSPGTYDFVIYGKDGISTITETDDGSITYTVDPDGPGEAEAFDIGDRDFNFKSLRGNLVLRWEYRPGSVFYLAWTHNRSASDPTGQFNLGSNLGDLAQLQGDNIFLLKFTYWLAP